MTISYGLEIEFTVVRLLTVKLVLKLLNCIFKRKVVLK